MGEGLEGTRLGRGKGREEGPYQVGERNEHEAVAGPDVQVVLLHAEPCREHVLEGFGRAAGQELTAGLAGRDVQLLVAVRDVVLPVVHA